MSTKIDEREEEGSSSSVELPEPGDSVPFDRSALRPIERAGLFYLEQQPEVHDRDMGEQFVEDHRLHLLHGYVFSTPTLFVMGRPIDRFDDWPRLKDPLVRYPPERENCWWLFLLAGEAREAWRYLPYPLPYIGWERRGKPRFFESRKLFPHTVPGSDRSRCWKI